MTVKEKALEKMFKEMNEKHSSTEDVIHNWLCDQEDELLFQGIVKKDKTIKGSLKYCTEQASKRKDGNVAMIDDNTVFGWIYKYFTAKKISKSKTNIQAKIVTSHQKKKTKNSNSDKGKQLSLFDAL